MDNDTSTQLQRLLDRLREGDDSAREELISHAFRRLGLLAQRIFHEDFSRLEAFHDTGSIVNEAGLKLWSALKEVQPKTVREFFILAAVKIRQVLIDLSRRRQQSAGGLNRSKPVEDSSAPGAKPCEPLDPAGEPIDIVMWTEFHESVDRLPEGERDVVHLHLYQGFTQAETAQLLGIHRNTVSQLWLQARLKLKTAVPGWE